MNTNALSKYYACLTPWERLPLIVSAAARGDDSERARLADSAPKLTFCVPDYWGLAEGLNQLAQLYLLEQLDRAALAWRVLALLNQEPLALDPQEALPREQRLWRLLQTMAYQFVVRADGWQRLCAELHLDPQAVLGELPGAESVRAMEEVARRLACTAEQAACNVRQAREGSVAAEGEAAPAHETAAVQSECRLESADEVARSMRQFLEKSLDSWS